jgi:hypothetical protein
MLPFAHLRPQMRNKNKKYIIFYFFIQLQNYKLKIIYNLKRLYNSSATNPPKICAKQYGIKSLTGSFPADAIVIDTAGLICPPETFAVSNMANANAAPIANGFPVANMI